MSPVCTPWCWSVGSPRRPRCEARCKQSMQRRPGVAHGIRCPRRIPMAQQATADLHHVTNCREEHRCQQAPHAVVLAEVQQLALDLQRRESAGRHDSRVPLGLALSPPRCTTRVRRSRRTLQPALRTRGSGRPPRSTGRSAGRTGRRGRSPRAAPGSSSRAPSRIRAPRRGPSRRSSTMRVPGNQRVQAGAQPGRRSRASETSGTMAAGAVLADQLHAQHAALRDGVHEAHGLGQSIGRHERVGVEQQHVAAARRASAWLLARPKPTLVGLAISSASGCSARSTCTESSRDALSTTMTCSLSRPGFPRAQRTSAEQVRRVVVDDDDGDVRLGGVGRRCAHRIGLAR